MACPMHHEKEDVNIFDSIAVFGPTAHEASIRCLGVPNEEFAEGGGTAEDELQKRKPNLETFRCASHAIMGAFRTLLCLLLTRQCRTFSFRE